MASLVLQRSVNRNYLRIVYLTLGILGFIFFLWTGRIMRFGYPDKENIEIGFRVMMRSRHIFLLLFSLLEIGIGVYIVQRADRLGIAIQIAATLCIVLAHVLFGYGFFYELSIDYVPETPIIHWAAYLSAAGIILHLATVVFRKNKWKKQILE